MNLFCRVRAKIINKNKLSPITAVRPRGDDGTAMPNAGRGTETWLRSKHRDGWRRSTER